MSKAKQKNRQVKSKSKHPTVQIMTGAQGVSLAGESFSSIEEGQNFSYFQNSAISRLIERIKSL